LDEINFSECFIAPWLLDVKNRDNVFVVEVPEQLHLAQGSQAEHGMVKGSDLLDSNLLPGGFMECRAISELAVLLLLVPPSQYEGLRGAASAGQRDNR